MLFSDQTYSVLVVSSAQKFTDVMRGLLPGSEYYPVTTQASAAAARRELDGRVYDFVIINAPLTDDFGVKLAIDALRPGTVVLLLVRAENYEEVCAKVTPQGVFTLPKPVSTQSLQQSLKWLAAGRERLRKLEQKTVSIEEKMEEIRLVNRAKWLLIQRLEMTEETAHRHIEKQAMDRCLTRREVALDIIHTYT